MFCGNKVSKDRMSSYHSGILVIGKAGMYYHSSLPTVLWCFWLLHFITFYWDILWKILNLSKEN